MTTEFTISTETIGTHEKTLSFHASPHPDEHPHIMAIYNIDRYLDQYVSLSDDAIDAIIEKREVMRAQIETNTIPINMRETIRIVNYLYDSDLLNIVYDPAVRKDQIAKMIDISQVDKIMTIKQQEYEEQVKATIDREEAIKNIYDVSNLGDYETIIVTTLEGKEIKTKLYGR